MAATQSTNSSERAYPARTVAMVALGSLVGSFLVVFGGGLLLFRSRNPGPMTAPTTPLPPPTQGRSFALSADSDAGATVEPTNNTNAANSGTNDPSTPDPIENAGAGSTPPPAGSATIGAISISRCFDAGPPTPIPGANCGTLAALQQYLQGKSTQIAACGRGGHGRLALVLDFRFSTSFARGWGSPASNVPRAGDVAGCVKQAILPLPYATLAHDHDRYYTTIPIDF